MTSVWVAEHGWVYLMAAIDCCTRENVERAVAERGITPGSLTLGTDNGRVHRPRVEGRPRRPGDRA